MKLLTTLIIVVMANANSPSTDESNFNLALSTKNEKHCSSIQKKDTKIECFGILKRNTGYCNMIKDKDVKNKCLSVALSDISYCDKIKNGTIKSRCKAYLQKK
ncbi:MAG: hypothetical protein KAG56_01790 [Sulfurovaceae bacterium]|nr:hypothetical protein [Sulfurovaceae bacterium]